MALIKSPKRLSTSSRPARISIISELGLVYFLLSTQVKNAVKVYHYHQHICTIPHVKKRTGTSKAFSSLGITPDWASFIDRLRRLLVWICAFGIRLAATYDAYRTYLDVEQVLSCERLENTPQIVGRGGKKEEFAPETFGRKSVVLSLCQGRQSARTRSCPTIQAYTEKMQIKLDNLGLEYVGSALASQWRRIHDW